MRRRTRSAVLLAGAVLAAAPGAAQTPAASPPICAPPKDDPTYQPQYGPPQYGAGCVSGAIVRGPVVAVNVRRRQLVIAVSWANARAIRVLGGRTRLRAAIGPKTVITVGQNTRMTLRQVKRRDWLSVAWKPVRLTKKRPMPVLSRIIVRPAQYGTRDQ